MNSRVKSLGLLVSLSLGCGELLPDAALSDREGGVAWVRVTATGTRGTLAAPLPFSTDGVPLTLRVEVFSRTNAPVTSFNGWVELSAAPGTLSVQSPGALGTYVRLTNGVVDGVEVSVSRAYGEARIWAEESGYVPVSPQRQPAPACANGLDDDGDGYVDYPADLGCAAANDDTERAGSYAVGTSEPVYFGTPLISDVQSHAALSTLVGARVTIAGRLNSMAPTAADPTHRLVVTQINNSGFYVTDIDDQSCAGRPCYNNMYAFNFHAPDGMRPCDLLATLTGSVAEFVNTTQFSQPGYQIGMEWTPNDPVAGACLIPDAVELDAATLANEAAIEPLESGLVRIRNVAMPTMMGPGRAPNSIPMAGATNCDLNDDGRIAFDNGPEEQCAAACAADPTCSEWSSWARYGQITVTMPGGASAGRIAVSPRSVDPTFDPENTTPRTATVTGTLQQVGPNWVINPRCGSDFVIDGTGQTVCEHPRDCCLQERSIGED